MTEATPPSGATKQEWRAWAKDVRSGLDFETLSGAVVDHLEAWPALGPGAVCLTYHPQPDEINLAPQAERLTQVRFAATRTPEAGGVLTVHKLGGPLEVHRLGFLQPHPSAPRIDPGDLTLMLMPGLSFDLWGGRLGRGGGYYDELLTRTAPSVLRVGVTPTACVVDALPQEAHDQPVHYLASEEGVIEVAK